MEIREIFLVGIDWIDFALDRDQWRAFVKALMNSHIP
jgi:hypothetical protein